MRSMDWESFDAKTIHYLKEICPSTQSEFSKLNSISKNPIQNLQSNNAKKCFRFQPIQLCSWSASLIAFHLIWLHIMNHKNFIETNQKHPAFNCRINFTTFSSLNRILCQKKIFFLWKHHQFHPEFYICVCCW